MREYALQLVYAFFGSLGFALIFHLRRRYLFTSSLGGLLSWGVFLLIQSAHPGTFFPAVAASAFVCVYSEVFARIKKTPANQYLVVGLLPLIPGGPLYYSMRGLVVRDGAMAQQYGYSLAMYALGIAVGVSATLSLAEMIFSIIKMRKKKLQK